MFVQQEKNLNELMMGRLEIGKEAIIAGWYKGYPEKRAVEAQASIDSVAYRKLFEGTRLANDSAAVADFNNVAKNSHPEKDGDSLPMLIKWMKFCVITEFLRREYTDTKLKTR